MQIAQHAEPAPTPASEVEHVQDYQQGWNDAQRGKTHKRDASIYYSMGFVDGSYSCVHPWEVPQ